MHADWPAIVRPAAQRVASRGFSLSEFVAVITIIAIISALVVPRFANSVALRRVDGAARRIAADLELARKHAMTASVSQQVQFVGGSDPGYTVTGYADMDRSAQEYVVTQALDLHGVEAVSVDFGGDLVIIFDMYGKPDSDGSVVIQAGSHSRTITLDAETGRASISA
jgi:prepilin-type N-terminal cleavage/methylation domain-containing protein